MASLGNCTKCSSRLAVFTKLVTDAAGNVVQPAKRVSEVRCSSCGHPFPQHPYQLEIDAETAAIVKAEADRAKALAGSSAKLAQMPEHQIVSPIDVLQKRMADQDKTLMDVLSRLAIVEGELAGYRSKKRPA